MIITGNKFEYKFKYTLWTILFNTILFCILKCSSIKNEDIMVVFMAAIINFIYFFIKTTYDLTEKKKQIYTSEKVSEEGDCIYLKNNKNFNYAITEEKKYINKSFFYGCDPLKKKKTFLEKIPNLKLNKSDFTSIYFLNDFISIVISIPLWLFLLFGLKIFFITGVTSANELVFIEFIKIIIAFALLINFFVLPEIIRYLFGKRLKKKGINFLIV